MKPMTSAERYREQDFLTAPPGRLLVLTFDALLTALTRARIGVATGNDELAHKAVQQARELLAELAATLDREKGGEIAKNLGALYVFALGRLHGIPKKGDIQRFDQLVKLLTPIRDAFNEVASAPSSAPRSAVA